MSTGKTYSTKYLLDSNNNRGAEGQVLISTSTGIDWSDGSDITGGPYLPLSAGSSYPLTGDLYIEEDSLYLLNASNNYWRVQNNSSGKLVFKQATTQRGIWSSGELQLANNLIVDGNVGIGTTNPGSKLELGPNGSLGANITNKNVILNIDGGYGTTGTPSSGQYKVIGFTGTTKDVTDITGQTSGEVLKNFYLGMIGGDYFNVNRFSFWQGGSERLTIQGYGANVGNVGIGTASPRVKLHVNGTNASVGTIGTPKSDWYTTAYNGIQVGDGTTLWGRASDSHFSGNYYVNTGGSGGAAQDTYINAFSAHDLWLDNSSGSLKYRNAGLGGAGSAISWNTRFVVLTNGNFGIGATAPLRKLHVAGGDGFAVNASTSQYYGVYIPALGEGANPQIQIGDWHNAGATVKWDSTARSLNLDTQYSTGAGTFKITGNDGASEFFRITSGGNVGIGTGSDVYGDLHLQGGQQDIVLTNDNADGVANLIISRIIGQARGYSNNGSAMQSIDFVTNATTWYKGDIVFKTNNTDGTDTSVAATEKMRIASNGNVGIGFTSPDLTPLATTKLSVNGNAYVAGYLGIGETSPAVPLHISRDSASGENIALLLDNNNTATQGSQIGMLFRCMADGANTDFEIFGEAKAANSMDLVFQSDGSVERMRLKSDGDLQIARYLEHLGDTNSYLGWSAADDFRIYTGGRELLRLDEGTDPDVLNFMSTNFSMSTGGELKLLNNGGAKLTFGGNGANPTTTAATIYDQSAVGLTLSAHNVSIRNYDGTNMIESARFVHDKLTCAGDVIAYGSPSDVRLKENIKPIESALDKVSKLQGVTFDWKKSDSILDIKEDIGFIAQDVQKVIPELVRENKDGMLSMRHQGIAPILLEAIKELKAEIEELKKQIK